MTKVVSFNPESWYNNLSHIVHLPSPQRYAALTQLHRSTAGTYIDALQKMTERQAEEISSDGRKKKIVVAHIMGWEEWQAQAFSDTNRLPDQMKLKGYDNPFTGETKNLP